MAGGFHNGFNPFRDAHGRWATPGGAGVAHAQQPGKGSSSMNDALRSASGRATGGGGGGGSGGSGGGGYDPAALAKATPTLQGGVKGAGMTPVDREEQGAIGRYLHPGASPEKAGVGGWTISAADKATMRARGAEEALGADFDSVASAPSHAMSDTLSFVLKDMDDAKGSLTTSILKDNGYWPTNPTKAEFNDLLATRYEKTSPEQVGREKLRQGAYALALGEKDMAIDLFDATGNPGSDLAAESLAAEFGVPGAHTTPWQ